MPDRERGFSISYFKIAIRREPDGVTVVELSGELDTVSAARLRKVAYAELPTSREMLLDLTALEFMDGGGLGALIEADHLAREAGVLLWIKDGPPAVQKVFRLTGFDTRLNFLAPQAAVLPTGAPG